jgi:hypothetical protein
MSLARSINAFFLYTAFMQFLTVQAMFNNPPNVLHVMTQTCTPFNYKCINNTHGQYQLDCIMHDFVAERAWSMPELVVDYAFVAASSYVLFGCVKNAKINKCLLLAGCLTAYIFLDVYK